MQLGSVQHDIVTDNKTLVEGLRKVVLMRDTPGMTDIDSSMYYLTEAIRKDHALSMSGECSDEILEDILGFMRKKESLLPFLGLET